MWLKQEPQVKASTGTLNGVQGVATQRSRENKVEGGETTCCALMRKRKGHNGSDPPEWHCGTRWTRLLRRPGFLMFSPYTHYFMEAIQWQHLHCILPPKIIIHMTASDNSFIIFRVLWNILIINAEQSIGTLDRNTSVTPVKQITFNRSC